MFDIDDETGLVLFSVCIVFIVNMLAYLRKKEDSQKLHSALAEYADEEIVKAVLSKKNDLHFEGEKKKVSIFFSDIKGFTSLSEKFEPEQLVNFLKEYFSIMSGNIHKYNGYIDKYEGDCVMALWGAFHGMQKDSYSCCLSAIKQQKALKVLNIKFRKTLGQEIQVRMGINTGEAVLGNIGAKGKKIEYTAFGDSVNVASRLEQTNKHYGTKICVSDNIYNECVDFFDFREIDTVLLKGRNESLRIYELLDEVGKTSAKKNNIVERYERALHLYYHGEYQKAANIFQKLKNIDPPSAVMQTRCKDLIKTSSKDTCHLTWKIKEN